MADNQPNPAMEFIVDSLKQNRAASYKEIAEAAGKKKLKIYPIMYGRAQALLGIVKAAPRGQGKAAKAKKQASQPAAPSTTAVAAAPKRGPGRPRKNPVAAPTSFDGSLESIVAAVKSSEQARARYRGALEKISSILAEALA